MKQKFTYGYKFFFYCVRVGFISSLPVVVVQMGFLDAFIFGSSVLEPYLDLSLRKTQYLC